MNDLLSYWNAHLTEIVGWAGTTIWLAGLPLAGGLLVGLPLGLLATRSIGWNAALIGASNIVYTVPSLVMFLVLPEVLGTGILAPVNVAVALTIYTASLATRSVRDGLDAVSPSTLAAAEAIGHTPWQVMWKVRLPLAVPVIAAGVRVAAVANVSLVSVASVIGTAQLGQLFVAGNNTGALTPIILGLTLFFMLAMAMDGVVVLLARLLTPWAR